ncbi:hypothetical protein [Paracoccus sp. (in: a-proteobacteria)]|uniref:hypothetical protein n=1 Tax=Paracoccus sp. TaxID=267 RepID=UPI003A86CEE5
MNLRPPAPQSPGQTFAGPRDHTLDLVRANVRNLLTRSAAFRALPKDRQQQVAADTLKVARYITDANGATSGTPMSVFIDNPAGAPARPFADPAPPPRPNAPSEGQRNFRGAGEDFKNAATKNAGTDLAAAIDAVDFPQFCASLIEGVFNAIVRTSIQQMEAYAAMVANVAKSVDQYMQDNVSNEQAMDQLVSAQPDLFEADMGGDQPTIAARQDADENQMGGFLQSLGLPFDLDAGDKEVVQTQVVPAMRKNIAMDRQKLLATMVLMGINRIVVTDGKISASCVFSIDAKDVLKRNQEINTSFEQNYNSRYNKSKREGWWIFTKSKESERTRLNVKTEVDTNQTDESESKSNLKAKLTGNVDLRFKSDYFPLEKMMDMLGTNETVITQIAQQPTPQQARQVGAGVPLPPAPPLPPPPPGMGG